MKELSVGKKWMRILATVRSNQSNYLQATLKVTEENLTIALENQRRIRKEKINTANTVTNGLDP